MEYSSPTEVAVCNLASIALNRFVKADRTYDWDKLLSVTKTVTRNLNKIIDVNYYPIPEAELSNKRHRPIGIGVQVSFGFKIVYITHFSFRVWPMLFS